MHNYASTQLMILVELSGDFNYVVANFYYKLK